MNERLKTLYKTHILTKSKEDTHFHKLEGATHVIEAYNPMCGDKYTLYLKVASDKVEQASFEGFGCAISRASTAVLVEKVMGKSFDEIDELVNVFLEIINENSEKEVGSLSSDESLQAFAGARQYPERLQCAGLSWQELEKADLNG